MKMALEYLYAFVDYFSGISFTSFALIITVCILLHYIFFSTGYYPHLPPSPTFKLPVIGHLHLLEHDMRKTLRKYHQQFGDLYTLYFGGRLGIVIAGYDTIKEAFLKNGDLFADRPSLYIIDLASRNRGIIFANGQRWKEHRRFALNALKNFGMGKSRLEMKVHEEAQTLVSEIEEYREEAFDPSDIINTHVANVICHMLFKGQFKSDDPRFLGLIELLDENMESGAGFANLIPWVANLPGDPFKCQRLISNTDKIYEYVEDIIDAHIKEYDEHDIDDLTSAYIKEMKRLEESGQQTTMNLEQLSGIVVDLFMAGSHTTTATIRWAIVCLVEYPEVQEKLYREIIASIGDQRLPSVADKTSLVYLEAFFLEVLRYCTITINTGMHATTRDLTFKGYTIPKDALLMPDIDSVLTDADIWDDPENFRPERFVNDDDTLRNREEMIAFFFGKRSCIGEPLARMELLIFLGTLVQRFRLECPQNETLAIEHVDGVFGLVHSPKRYKVIARTRVAI